MFGLIGLYPDFAMIIVGANQGILRMTKEHLGIALSLKIPYIIDFKFNQNKILNIYIINILDSLSS